MTFSNYLSLRTQIRVTLRGHPPPGRARAEGEEVRATKLQELAEMAAKLLATARKLPPGPDRINILQEIGSFRLQIISLQGVGLRPARRGLKAKGK
jgi:hypothetical protein